MVVHLVGFLAAGSNLVPVSGTVLALVTTGGQDFVPPVRSSRCNMAAVRIDPATVTLENEC
jgi:hypothetical protein